MTDFLLCRTRIMKHSVKAIPSNAFLCARATPATLKCAPTAPTWTSVPSTPGSAPRARRTTATGSTCSATTGRWNIRRTSARTWSSYQVIADDKWNKRFTIKESCLGGKDTTSVFDDWEIVNNHDRSHPKESVTTCTGHGLPALEPPRWLKNSERPINSKLKNTGETCNEKRSLFTSYKDGFNFMGLRS